MENNLSTGDKKNKSNKVENFAELLEESFSKKLKSRAGKWKSSCNRKGSSSRYWF